VESTTGARCAAVIEPSPAGRRLYVGL